MAAVALLAGAQDRHSLCLFFDLNSMSAAEQVRARDYAIQFLQKREQGDAIAILTRTTQLHMVQDFTADHDVLIAALRKNIPIDSGAATGDPDARVRTLQDAATMLATVAGKKSLIYFSTGVPMDSADARQVRAAIAAAKLANVAFYPVDSRAR